MSLTPTVHTYFSQKKSAYIFTLEDWVFVYSLLHHALSVATRDLTPLIEHCAILF
jgi:hypothetical protein